MYKLKTCKPIAVTLMERSATKKLIEFWTILPQYHDYNDFHFKEKGLMFVKMIRNLYILKNSGQISNFDDKVEYVEGGVKKKFMRQNLDSFFWSFYIPQHGKKSTRPEL